MFQYMYNETITFLNAEYCIKSHAIRNGSHVLTGKTQCINQIIHVLLIHGFKTLHIGILGRRNMDVINSYVHRNECYLVTLG